jgi:hypothetical protein
MTSHRLPLKLGALAVGIVSACSLTVPSEDELFGDAPGGSSGSSAAGTAGNAASIGGDPSGAGGNGGTTMAGGGHAPTSGTGPGAGGSDAGAPQGGAGGEPPEPRPTGELMNPSFETDLTGWVVDPANFTKTPRIVWSQWGGPGAPSVMAFDGNYVLSTWSETMPYTVRISQVIEGLEDGTYDLKAYASNISTIARAELYARDCGGADPEPVAMPGATALIEFALEGIEVTGGKCEVGFYIEATTKDWVNVDHVRFEKVDAE